MRSAEPHDENSDETYLVKIREEQFPLTRSQLEAEPGNLLANVLLGGSAEGWKREIRLDRHPATFKLIVAHLQGYPILPLESRDWFDLHTSEDKLLRYLKTDAEYYSMPKLSALIDAEEVRLESRKQREEEEERLFAGDRREDIARREERDRMTRDIQRLQLEEQRWKVEEQRLKAEEMRSKAVAEARLVQERGHTNPDYARLLVELAKERHAENLSFNNPRRNYWKTIERVLGLEAGTYSRHDL